MKKINCRISFNSELIYPQNTLSGTIIITSPEKDCSINSIKIEVIGESSCEWKYNKCLVKFPRIYKKNQKFTGKQQIFFSRHTLAGGNIYSIELNESELVYPFKTTFTNFLPGTWKGKYGKIEYILRVLIKEADGNVQIFTKEIILSHYRNLSLEDHLLHEARCDIHRFFFFSFINLGNVNVNVWLPLCGIAAGQSVPLLCTIINNSTILFGGLIFILTQIEIYRSTNPTKAIITFRKDICRVARMVNILRGTYEYYAVLKTNDDIVPTNQYVNSNCCQVVYEVWVSLQGVIPRYQAYGYPNINTPPIPLIIGTKPICKFNADKITNVVMGSVYQTHPTIIMEALPPDDEVEEMLIIADEQLDEETEENLIKQLVKEPLYVKASDPFDSTSSSSEEEDVNTSNKP